MVQGDQWSRVRKLAYNMAYGVPNANISMLPSLVVEMEKHGHALEFTTYDGVAACAVILSVRKAEAERLRKKAAKKSVLNRTLADIDDLLPWAEQKACFLLSHKALLQSVNEPGLRYVDYMAFSFGFVEDQFPTLLCLVSADACFCHFSLGAYQLFSMIGIS